ncbi:MAG: ABC1 kinase family protein [Myxococcota bacterium]
MLAVRADRLPDEVRHEFGMLVDRAPARPFATVQARLQAQLGTRLRELEWIDPAPLATASIAQVHRARLRDGTPLALKVRHPELTPERVERDLAALGPWLRLAARRVGLPDPGALLAEAESVLRLELDLEREGRIAESLRRDFAGWSAIVVPRVHWRLTAPGVLALDYLPALRLDEPATLRTRGIDPAACARTVADAYGRQVFGRGVFHADPHPGNVLAVDERPADPAHPRVLFVDFGLSSALEPAQREALRRGLRALLQRDVEAILDELEAIGAIRPGARSRARGALEEALASGADRALEADRAGLEELIGRAKGWLRESDAFAIPRGLLLFARTLAHVLDLCRRIDPQTDPMRRLVPYVLRFLASPPRSAGSPGTLSPGNAASGEARSGE